MKYHYEPGTVRWFRHEGPHDVRAHRPANGWEAQADNRLPSGHGQAVAPQRVVDSRDLLGNDEERIAAGIVRDPLRCLRENELRTPELLEAAARPRAVNYSRRA